VLVGDVSLQELWILQGYDIILWEDKKDDMIFE